MPLLLKFDTSSPTKQSAVIPDATQKSAGLMTAAMVKKLDGLSPTPPTPPYEYVVQQGAPHAGVFTTIAAAIAAAVTDGASGTNPKGVIVQPGVFSGLNVVLPAGVSLFAAGGRGSVVLVDSTINFVGASFNEQSAITGFRFASLLGAATPFIDTTGSTGGTLFLDNCELRSTNATASLVKAVAGTQIICRDSSVIGAIGSPALPPAILSTEANIFLFGSGVTGAPAISATSTQGNGILIRSSTVTGFGDTAVIVNGSPGFGLHVTCYHSEIVQLDGTGSGIDMLSADTDLTISFCNFQVVDGGANNTISRVANAILWWGGLTFQPAAGGYTNRLQTTPAGATNMVVDAITAV